PTRFLDMAIAIEGYSIVALKSRIEEKYAGGLAAFSKTVPNSTELADDSLWRCSFMTMADAERFLEQVQRRGMNSSQGPDSDFVLVDEFDCSVTPYCEWLQVAQWEKGVIAWQAGTTPSSVMARDGWSPEKGSGFQFASARDDENLEFRRLDGNVAVYFDKRRGCEVYVGQVAPDPNEVFLAASQVIRDHCVDPARPKLNSEVEAKVRQAISSLETIAGQFPDAWAAHFFIGKGKMGVEDLQGAYESLRRAYDLETDNESVPRELAGACLELGKPDEAVQIGQKAAALKPDNVETLTNLACAYLIAGRLSEAITTVDAALKINAKDPTGLVLRRLARSVMSGALPQPKRLSDLTNAAGQISSLGP
ncbi:MAG TPA: tetratricopeptide repeat protein, partial [Planctomycetaceae bacterium]